MSNNTSHLINSDYFNNIAQQPQWEWTREELDAIQTMLKAIEPNNNKQTKENKLKLIK